MAREELVLHPDRLFDPAPGVRTMARELYESVRELPIVSPHGHVNPKLFAGEKVSFGDPTELFIIPDHYLFRMLYSQGIHPANLGVPRIDGGKVETDHRKIWQAVADHFYLFRGTPTGLWLDYEFSEVFGLKYRLSSETAMEMYDEIKEKLQRPEYYPRALFEKFGIEVLCTTDSATDTLKDHEAIRRSDWKGDIRPSFRPDSVINGLGTEEWRRNIEVLSDLAGIDISDFKSYLEALKRRREYFKKMGATATDSAALTPYTEQLSSAEVETLFQRGLKGKATPEEAARFTSHLLIEMAGLSVEDGLVMQLHPGSFRDHNELIYGTFGRDKGGDIPIQVDFTRGLKALLNKYGNNPKLTLVIFTLDEDTYSRELAPLAGHYPALRLGPPWWFHDSVNGIRRYLDRITETAGIYNLAGFNDDTRAFPSIPARHDVWRRCCANWLAGLVSRHIIAISAAREIIIELVYRLAKKTYRL